jgi:hypothetical protein
VLEEQVICNIFIYEGHEVPFWQPESSYVLIDSFLKSSQLPKKTKERIFQKKKSSKKSEGKRNK